MVNVQLDSLLTHRLSTSDGTNSTDTLCKIHQETNGTFIINIDLENTFSDTDVSSPLELHFANNSLDAFEKSYQLNPDRTQVLLTNGLLLDLKGLFYIDVANLERPIDQKPQQGLAEHPYWNHPYIIIRQNRKGQKNLPRTLWCKPTSKIGNVISSPEIKYASLSENIFPKFERKESPSSVGECRIVQSKEAYEIVDGQWKVKAQAKSLREAFSQLAELRTRKICTNSITCERIRYSTGLRSAEYFISYSHTSDEGKRFALEVSYGSFNTLKEYWGIPQEDGREAQETAFKIGKFSGLCQ